ncbi:MAG: hypothetical protein LBE13_10950 [Bacteroidales bacterium]|jgi:hypothetical protein|nr:hypothetical protein [Bacteroidales bacterium]
MIYIVCFIVIWVVIGILFFRKELKSFFFPEQEKDELPEDGLMGIAHDVFQIEEQIAKDEIKIGNVLSEADFEVEYEEFGDEIEFNGSISDSDTTGDSVTPEKSIIGFNEMQQMVAVVESDKPLQHIDNEKIEEARQIIKRVEGTDFFEKMIKIREDISRRIDEIQNSI